MSHIQSLFYTFIWTFAPDLIKDGYIYTSVPPLYKISSGKGYRYLKDDAALEAFKLSNPGKKNFEVKRLKGLGELNVEDLEETMLDPNNRVLKQITLNDMASANKLFNDLMGDSASPRKAYIEKHSGEIEVTG